MENRESAIKCVSTDKKVATKETGTGAESKGPQRAMRDVSNETG